MSGALKELNSGSRKGRVFKQCMVSCFSCVRLFANLGTVAFQAPLSMGFSRQEYWSGLLCPPPGDLPHSGIKLMSLTSPALAGGFFITEPPRKPRQRDQHMAWRTERVCVPIVLGDVW